jgi:hypothetical protein
MERVTLGTGRPTTYLWAEMPLDEWGTPGSMGFDIPAPLLPQREDPFFRETIEYL